MSSSERLECKDQLERARTLILEWAQQGSIAEDCAQEAMAITGVLPGPTRWRRFLDRLLLWSGAALVAVGVIFFLAFNWRELGRVMRFGTVEMPLVLAVLAALWVGLDRPSGKASLFVAALLTGGVLALFGQTYQTGADTFELFLTWALLISPWVAVARLPALWMLLLVLLNAAIALYFHAFGRVFWFLAHGDAQLWLLFGFNSVALVMWELSAVRFEWLRGRWGPRLLGCSAGVLMTTLAVKGVFESGDGGGMIAYVVWLGATVGTYRYLKLELFMLSGAVLSGVVVVASLLTEVFQNSFMNGGAFLFIGVVVIALSALGGWWLKGVAREQADG